MVERHEQLKRALRSVKRSIDPADSVHWPAGEANQILMNAVQQLVFIVEKLVEELGARDTRSPEG